jgi:CHASE2 domain-containing sensor protein/tRNA A-37 threonylcarbamoyl transferase component Bud32
MEQYRTPHTQKTRSRTSWIESLQHSHWGRALAGVWVAIVAIATATNGGLVQMIEYQTQTLFFEIRGTVVPPDDIVILTIDEQSLSIPQQYYQTNPQQYSDLKPLQAWPWQRLAYAQAIDKLITAGVRGVALDVVFATPSSYGTADDREFAKVLQRYAGRVTLAAEYEQSQLRQGNAIQLTTPNRLFWTKPMSVGFVNFPLEVDGRIHRFASEFPLSLAAKSQQQFDNYTAIGVEMLSFEQAVARAAVLGDRGTGGQGDRGNSPSIFPLSPHHPLPLSSSPIRGNYIYFYGPAGTFEHIPFWHVLDPENWNTYLQQGRYFQGKVVIVGATAASLQDFHKVPFSGSWLYPQPMSGVEIQANAIATRLQQRAIASAIPNSIFQGLLVLLLGAGTTILLGKVQRPMSQLGGAIGIAIAWGSMSYAAFTYQYLILPTAVPILAIVLCGASYCVTGLISDRRKIAQLQPIATGNTTVLESPEANNQRDELQKLLSHELVTAGKILGGRYQIVKVLGSGGFSETYIAEDLQRPGKPTCVVKRLKSASSKPQQLQLASRLFQLEAETLETLGKHDQIPQLLAYFQQDEEFFLVQELIDGHPLSWELRSGKPVTEMVAIAILQDLLPILTFVHNCKTIHRDIKPSNIMRRHSDGKLVLIDFGAVKQVSNQMLAANEHTKLTASIGTLGYAPAEQTTGRAFFSSDIYAVGMLAIKALTGFAPHELQLDPQTGEVLWLDKAQVSQELAAFIGKMVRYDYTQRYQSASEALAALQDLSGAENNLSDRDNLPITTVSVVEDSDANTLFWQPVSSAVGGAENLSDPPNPH